MPQNYHDFVFYIGEWLYVATADVTLDAPAAQKDVTVEDGSLFAADMPVWIKDSAHSEWNEVDSVLGNVVTMKTNLQYTYYTAKGAVVDHTDLSFGRAAFAAAFALEYLYEAYSAGQFSSSKTAILARIAELADFIVTQQCTNPALKAYGGFKSAETSVAYYSIDAGRCIPALLKAYKLTNDADYLDAAKLAGYTFLYNMQHDPAALGLTDTYYGGLAMYVTDADAYSTIFMIEDLYDLIGLCMLARVYDKANAARYNAIMEDMLDFYREGLETFYLYYQPPPSGLGVWYRIGLSDEQIYDDPVSYALLGLYAYEDFSETVQRVYDFIQSIPQNGTYPAYQPCVCWPGYINVVTKAPDCAYYDAVTIGILESIRKVVDKPSYELAYQIVNKYPDEFLYWGPIYTDYSPITPQKAVTEVAWVARMFLNYSLPWTDFIFMLESEGERVQLYSVKQAADATTYGEALALPAVVKNAVVKETYLEAGYIITDYLEMYSLLPVRPRDKIRRRGCDYEVQTVEKVIQENQLVCYKSQLRRLQNN